MHLIEIFLPVYGREGTRFPQKLYATTRDELVSRYGGLTAHSLTPVAGLWESDDGEIVRDDMIVYEVLAERVEKSWWQQYRKTLESRFDQTRLLVRSNEVSLL